MKTKMTPFGCRVGTLVAAEHVKAFTFGLMFLVALTSITWAQSSDPHVMVAQAPAQAPAQAGEMHQPQNRPTGLPGPVFRVSLSSIRALESVRHLRR